MPTFTSHVLPPQPCTAFFDAQRNDTNSWLRGAHLELVRRTCRLSCRRSSRSSHRPWHTSSARDKLQTQTSPLVMMQTLTEAEILRGARTVHRRKSCKLAPLTMPLVRVAPNCGACYEAEQFISGGHCCTAALNSSRPGFQANVRAMRRRAWRRSEPTASATQ